MEYFLFEGDSLEVLKEMDDNSVDSVVTDPPYGLGKEPDITEVMKDWIEKGHHEVKSKGGFMGKEWDSFVPQPILWKEVLRVLKPGGYALVACGTRTQDWMAASLRFAGFEIRDVITWHYGSGFPKSLNISKAIDKQAGVEREIIGSIKTKDIRRNVKEDDFDGQPKFGTGAPTKYMVHNITASATEEAKQWDGWGTALKPATEFWTLARKPLSEKTVAENVLRWGTGGINIDGCRIETDDNLNGGTYSNSGRVDDFFLGIGNKLSKEDYRQPSGRFPANLILDEFMAAEMDKQSGISKSTGGNGSKFKAENRNAYSNTSLFNQVKDGEFGLGLGDSGGASRFFYVAKANKKERNAGLEDFELKTNQENNKRVGQCNSSIRLDGSERKPVVHHNNHPTVKPINLMRYFVRLITPKRGICLDPFNGSGTTGCGCALEDIDYIGIDKNDEGVDCIGISEARIAYWKKEAEKIINN